MRESKISLYLDEAEGLPYADFRQRLLDAAQDDEED
jgi:hypothetical protein